MSFDARILVIDLGSFSYWVLAAVALFVILLPCGMGPEADCDMGSPATFWLAVAGFILIYAGLLMRFRRWTRS